MEKSISDKPQVLDKPNGLSFFIQNMLSIDKYIKLSYNKIVLNELHNFCVRLITFVYKHDRHLARSFFLQNFQIFRIDKIAFSWYNKNIYKWKSRHQNVVFALFLCTLSSFCNFFEKCILTKQAFCGIIKIYTKDKFAKGLGFPSLFCL